MFYRLRERENAAIDTHDTLYLNGILSYLGRTNDKINAVRGIGVRISALLGTLAMLFNDENLRALRPVIQFGSHVIVIELGVENYGKYMIQLMWEV